MRPIHVGILISYDYQYLPLCLSRIYDSADKITLAIDKHRRTWAGKPYDFDETFLAEILANDPQNKISLYEDDFSMPNLGTMECDRRERRMLRQFMKSEEESAWHLQIDTDEYFVDFPGFVEFLHEVERNYKGNVTVMPRLATIFKLDSDGIILTKDKKDTGCFPVACYGGCRFSPAPDDIEIKCDFKVLHQSWGRSEDEIKYKISNWGHNADFDTDAYFEFWKSINRFNAPYITDCHPLSPKCGWNRLVFEPGDINQVLTRLNNAEKGMKKSHTSLLQAKFNRLKFNLKSSKSGQVIKSIIRGGRR